MNIDRKTLLKHVVARVADTHNMDRKVSGMHWAATERSDQDRPGSVKKFRKNHCACNI